MRETVEIYEQVDLLFPDFLYRSTEEVFYF